MKTLMDRHRPTVMQATPSFWRMMRIGGWENRSLHSILCGGEMLDPHLAGFLLRQPNCELHNLYGPTETTIWSGVGKIRTANAIDIGQPIQQTQFAVLNRQNKPVVKGAVGEIAIGGAGVFGGYLNHSDQNDRIFTRLNGQKFYKTGDYGLLNRQNKLFVIGRRDQQVKVRGHRIELSEIESKLSHHPSILECAVVDKKIEDETVLAAYYQAKETIDKEQIVERLRQSLPGYMCPQHLIELDCLPKTENQKIDRNALKQLPIARTMDSVRPQAAETPVQQVVRSIWEEIFPSADFSIDDDFAELGGHSVNAVQLIALIEIVFRCRLPVIEIRELKTVRNISHRIRHEIGNDNADSIANEIIKQSHQESGHEN
jgi:surfactin family lipopeptide synthetase A